MERMELQANTFPRYIMIPEETGREHARQLLAGYGGTRDFHNMQRLVDDMADYYGTTKTMARSRLVDFGYEEARGIMQSTNGVVVPAFRTTLPKDETYVVSEEEALQEFLRNEEFRRTILTGNYLYVPSSGCYCLNDPKYLRFARSGSPCLTDYACSHMEECCLVFKIMPNRDRRLFPNGLFQKGMGRGHRNISYVRPDGGSLITNEGERLRQEIERMMQEDRCLSVNFNQMTVELMKQKRMTVNALAEATGLSEETIKNLRNRESIAFPIQEIVAVCIALHLPPQRSGPYINISPSKFLNTVDMKLYEYALTQW